MLLTPPSEADSMVRWRCFAEHEAPPVLPRRSKGAPRLTRSATPTQPPVQAVAHLSAQLAGEQELVGRQSELAQLQAALLGERRLAVLLGAPGRGKTRLALELGRAAEVHHAGTIFLDLSGVQRCAMSERTHRASTLTTADGAAGKERWQGGVDAAKETLARQLILAASPGVIEEWGRARVRVDAGACRVCMRGSGLQPMARGTLRSACKHPCLPRAFPGCRARQLPPPCLGALADGPAPPRRRSSTLWACWARPGQSTLW